VQIHVVAEHGGGDHRILLVLIGEFLELAVEVTVDDRVLLDPADFIFLRLHLEKAASVLQNFKGLAVGHLADAIGHGGDAIVQVHLAGGDVDGLVMFVTDAAAAGHAGRQGQSREAGNYASSWEGEERQLGACMHNRGLF
jgi:hypothetical protein